MKIFSWNVNGLRAVHKKNFLDWFHQTDSDFICLQEIKAQDHQVPAEIKAVPNYHSYYNSAAKAGYSGVAIYTKIKPSEVIKSIGLERFDDEGRFLQLNFPNFSLINLYLPQGGRQKENMDYKLAVYNYLLQYIRNINVKNLILAGDFNIARTEIDLARPKQNQNNTMFTPEERSKIQKLINQGFIDTFRAKNSKTQTFTWWPYWANARARNLGWRIDYVFISKNLKPKLQSAFIETTTPGSDHCPVGIEINPI